MSQYRVTVTVPKHALQRGATVFAVARLVNGTRLSARLYFDAEARDRLERTATNSAILRFPGKPAFTDEHVELERGEQVELLAGDQVVLTCRVIA